MVTTKAIAKVAAVATGLAMAMSMLSFAPMAQAALTPSQVSAIISLLQSFGADASTIANVQASLTGGTPSTPPSSSACSFSRSLTIGSQGADVTCLQQALIAGGFSIPAGATGYFGTQTRTAVASWQSSKNIAPAVGYFGPISRAAFNLGGTPGTPGVPGVPITGNGLKVMLASDSPNGIALVAGQAIGALGKFTLVNPTGSEIKVTNLSFKRIGVSNDSTLSNVYLYEGAKRLTDSAGVSNAAFNFNDSNGVVTVPANSSKSVSVLADIAASTAGQQVGVQLVSVASTGTLDTSVVFPITGGQQTVSAATLATVDFNTTTLPSGTTVSPQNDYVVWQNTVTVSTRAVNLESFQLRNIGSIKREDIRNFRLMVDGVQVGSSVASIASDDTITFDLSGSAKRLETGGRVIKVVGDIVGGSGNTFQFSLRRASDARVVDTDLSQPVLATANGSTFSARSATSATIDSGTVSVVKANSSPSSNVSLGATNVKWATFELRAAGEDVKVESLDVQANTSADHGLDNGKVFLNGVQVGSTKDLTDATDVNFTFGSSFILKAGEVAIVDIYADAKTTTGAAFTTGETAAITLGTGSSNGQGQSSLASINVPTADTAANTITVSSSALTLTKYSGYGNQTLIAGASNALVGSFTLSTGATEGVNVNTITIALSSDEKATITDLMLKDRATGAQIGTTKPSPTTSNDFSTNFNIAASGTKTIDIYANIKSGSNIGSWIANADAAGTGSSTGTSVDADAADLQTITVGSSVITGAVNSGLTPDNANVIAGTAGVKVGSFRFTSQYSPWTVQEVKVKIPANAATSVNAVVLKYKDAAGVNQTVSQSLALSSGAAQTHSTATFTGLTFYVPLNSDANLDVYVDLATIASGATSGAAISVLLDDDEGFKAVDSSGSSDTDIGSADLNSAGTSGEGTMYVRKSLPTITSTPVTTALNAGAEQDIGQFTITADAAGDISWDKISFTVNKTAAVTLDATTTVKLWQGSNTVAGTFGTTTGDLVTQTQMFTTSATSGNIVFVPTSEQQIGAGQSATYVLRTTVGGLAAGSNLSVSIANPSTSITTGTASAVGVTMASTPSLTWSDRSVITSVHDTTTSDWTNDYLVKNLPISIGNRSVSF